MLHKYCQWKRSGGLGLFHSRGFYVSRSVWVGGERGQSLAWHLFKYLLKSTIWSARQYGQRETHTHPNISSIQKQTESTELRRVCLLNLLSLLLRVAVVARGHLEIDISRKSKKQALTCHRLQLEEGDYYQSGTQLGCCVTLCSVFGADCPGINKPLNRLSNSKTIPTDVH